MGESSPTILHVAPKSMWASKHHLFDSSQGSTTAGKRRRVVNKSDPPGLRVAVGQCSATCRGLVTILFGSDRGVKVCVTLE